MPGLGGAGIHSHILTSPVLPECTNPGVGSWQGLFLRFCTQHCPSLVLSVDVWKQKTGRESEKYASLVRFLCLSVLLVILNTQLNRGSICILPNQHYGSVSGRKWDTFDNLPFRSWNYQALYVVILHTNPTEKLKLYLSKFLSWTQMPSRTTVLGHWLIWMHS